MGILLELNGFPRFIVPKLLKMTLAFIVLWTSASIQEDPPWQAPKPRSRQDQAPRADPHHENEDGTGKLVNDTKETPLVGGTFWETTPFSIHILVFDFFLIVPGWSGFATWVCQKFAPLLFKGPKRLLSAMSTMQVDVFLLGKGRYPLPFKFSSKWGVQQVPKKHSSKSLSGKSVKAPGAGTEEF